MQITNAQLAEKSAKCLSENIGALIGGRYTRSSNKTITSCIPNIMIVNLNVLSAFHEKLDFEQYATQTDYHNIAAWERNDKLQDPRAKLGAISTLRLQQP